MLALSAGTSCLSRAGIPDAMMAQTEDAIHLQHPLVPLQTLRADRLVVDKAFRSVQPRLKGKGFSDPEIANLVLTVWSEKRKDPRTELSEAIIINESKKYGLLVVESTPDKAAVTVDRSPMPDTECRVFVPGGTYHITISKQGYEPAEGNQVVSPDGKATFKRELRKIP